tara:strand:- start:421 stop:717 length:297 start_codon:yes stop_codon:yes gene_type:complete
MHNIDQVKRRLTVSGSGMPLASGEIKMLLKYLISEVERLDNEISVHRPETDRTSGESISSPRTKLRGRKQPRSSNDSSTSSGSTGIDSQIESSVGETE